jgi:hypothetical protein
MSLCSRSPFAARAGHRRVRRLSALRAHTKAPYKVGFHRKTLRPLNHPWAAWTDIVAGVIAGLARRRDEGERRQGARRRILVELAWPRGHSRAATYTFDREPRRGVGCARTAPRPVRLGAPWEKQWSLWRAMPSWESSPAHTPLVELEYDL